MEVAGKKKVLCELGVQWKHYFIVEFYRKMKCIMDNRVHVEYNKNINIVKNSYIDEMS